MLICLGIGRLKWMTWLAGLKRQIVLVALIFKKAENRGVTTTLSEKIGQSNLRKFSLRDPLFDP
jgi:hypothetical protein